MAISSTGDGLNILIACDYLPHHGWMSYFCWYSLSKNLPDAFVTVASHRRLMTHNFFGWTRLCKIPFVLHKATDEKGQIELAIAKNQIEKPLLVIPPEVVCIRDFEEADYFPEKITDIKKIDDELCCDCKDDKPTVFATYLNGWGKFNTPSWIHKMSGPFISNAKFGQGAMTANEVRIERLWSDATPLYQIVARR
jgi:hypothetical protein